MYISRLKRHIWYALVLASAKWVKRSIAGINFRRTIVKKILSQVLNILYWWWKVPFQKDCPWKKLVWISDGYLCVVYVLLLTLGLIRPLLLRRLVEFSRPQKNDHSKAKFRAAEKARKRSTELQSSRIDWHLRIMVQTPDRIKHSLLELPPSLFLM